MPLYINYYNYIIMNKSLIRIFTALLFCSFSTIFLYAENNSEIATNDWKDGDEVTVSIEIGGQPGEYIFYSPQQQIIEFDGGANQIYRMKGTYYSGMGGVLVRFTVKATTSTSSRFSVFSPNYQTVLKLGDSRTLSIEYVIPPTRPSAQMGLLE